MGWCLGGRGVHCELGEIEKTEALYRVWLEADPHWGWGWIGWSDCYRSTRTASQDLERSEQLLMQALSIADVRDRQDVAERLADVYEEHGRTEAAAELRRLTSRRTPRQGAGIVQRRTKITFGGEGVPLRELPNIVGGRRTDRVSRAMGRKVGRNEPCPCGSGKKFKRCCGVGSVDDLSGYVELSPGE